jgi:hypothetical protein
MTSRPDPRLVVAGAGLLSASSLLFLRSGVGEVSVALAAAAALGVAVATLRTLRLGGPL